MWSFRVTGSLIITYPIDHLEDLHSISATSLLKEVPTASGTQWKPEASLQLNYFNILNVSKIPLAQKFSTNKNQTLNQNPVTYQQTEMIPFYQI